jgi:hypothetical protein
MITHQFVRYQRRSPTQGCEHNFLLKVPTANLVKSYADMQDIDKTPVFILCGGLGTRLKEETEFRPKPMVPIGNFHTLAHHALLP